MALTNTPLSPVGSGLAGLVQSVPQTGGVKDAPPASTAVTTKPLFETENAVPDPTKTATTMEQYFPIYFTMGGGATADEQAQQTLLDKERNRKIAIYAALGILLIIIVLLFTMGTKKAG